MSVPFSLVLTNIRPNRVELNVVAKPAHPIEVLDYNTFEATMKYMAILLTVLVKAGGEHALHQGHPFA